MAHDDWIHFVVFGPCKIFCFLNRSLQKKIVSENSPWRDYFKKQKILQGPKTNFFLQGIKPKRGIFVGTHYKKCCILPGVEALAKCRKALANGRLPGVLPGAESSPNLLIADDPARALAAGKFAGFCRLCQHHISHFQTMPRTLPGVNPWQNAYEFKKKNVLKLFKKSKY